MSNIQARISKFSGSHSFQRRRGRQPLPPVVQPNLNIVFVQGVWKPSELVQSSLLKPDEQIQTAQLLSDQFVTWPQGGVFARRELDDARSWSSAISIHQTSHRRRQTTSGRCFADHNRKLITCRRVPDVDADFVGTCRWVPSDYNAFREWYFSLVMQRNLLSSLWRIVEKLSNLQRSFVTSLCIMTSSDIRRTK